MAIDLTSKLSSLQNLIEKNNTISSSYNVSSGLGRQVRSFYRGVRGLHEKQPIAKTMYPAITVELSTKAESFVELGRNTNRDMEVYYDIVSIVDHVELPGSGRSDSDIEAIKLAQNIESLLRANISLSNTCDYSEIESTDYNQTIREDTHNSMAKITLKVKYYRQS